MSFSIQTKIPGRETPHKSSRGGQAAMQVAKRMRLLRLRKTLQGIVIFIIIPFP